MAAGYAWVEWEKVSKIPGITQVVEFVREHGRAPAARADRFSVAIAVLENDKDGAHRRLIRDALSSQFEGSEVEVLLPERSIEVDGAAKPQAAIEAGHARARSILEDTKADVMIWGEALDAKPDGSMRLHWTVNKKALLYKSSDKYKPVDNLDLPPMFWQDLTSVFGLLAANQSVAFFDQRGSYIADRLGPFIERVRALTTTRKFDGYQRAGLLVVLGDSLSTMGEQQSDTSSLNYAVTAYREALRELTHERAPLDWAHARVVARSGLSAVSAEA